MKRTILAALLIGIAAQMATTAQTQPASQQKSLAATMNVYVFPAQGQAASQQSKDESECYNWAVKNTGTDPFELTKQAQAAQQQQAQAAQSAQGSGARSAAKGAAGGALIGAIAGDAGTGAAIGAATGAVTGGTVATRRRRSPSSSPRTSRRPPPSRWRISRRRSARAWRPRSTRSSTETRTSLPNPYKSLKYPRLTVDSFVVDGRGRLLLVRRGPAAVSRDLGTAGRVLRDGRRRPRTAARGRRSRRRADACGWESCSASTPSRTAIPRGHNVTVLYAARRVAREGEGRRRRGGGAVVHARASSRASTSPSTTARSSRSSWLAGLDGGRRVLLGALGAAPLEDEHLARRVELHLVPAMIATASSIVVVRLNEVEILAR